MTVLRHRYGLALLLAGAAWLMPAAAAELPRATQQLLSQAKLDPGLLAGIDAELAVPQGWIDGARREADVKVLASWDPAQFRTLTAPFRERYPFVKLTYMRGSLIDRGIKALEAFKADRYFAAVITSPGTYWEDYREAGALADLRALPNYRLLAAQDRDAGGLWIGQKIAYRCMAYNTDRIAKSDLPRRWDDLVTNMVWRNGTLGIPNRPNLWLSQLWHANGAQWTTDFITKLFRDVKPQLRQEGSSASVGLTVAGEVPAMVAAAEYRVKEYQEKGAPVNLHCPEPIPTGTSMLLMMKNTPAPNGTYLFLDWFISKEGQIAQYVADRSLSVHPDLKNDPRLVPFPEEIIGKTLAPRDEYVARTEYADMMRVYEPLWSAAGGPEIKTDE
jgi:ABC-type Fe3+ transport system substrate-binding protein